MTRRADKATCVGLFDWLRANLGRGPRDRGVFSALTGTDWRALAAAAHILELYSICNAPAVIEAFRHVVMQMQPKTRYFAFHAIAFLAEWETRARLWKQAGLSFEDLEHSPRCSGDRSAWTASEWAELEQGAAP